MREMKQCKYYVLAIDYGTYRNHIGIECRKKDCTIEKTGLCDIVLGERKRKIQGIELINIYDLGVTGD